MQEIVAKQLKAYKIATINAYADAATPTVKDAVRAVTTAGESPRVDLQIKRSNEPTTAYALDNVYQTTPSGDQSEAQVIICHRRTRH